MKLAVNTAKLLKNIPLPDEITQVFDNSVVMDVGSESLKAGFAGDDAPRIVMPTVATAIRGPRGEPRESLAGNVAFKQRAEVDLLWPVDKGEVRDWDAMERLWEHVYTDSLRMPPDDRFPTLLTEPALASRDHRQRIAEVFFEKLRVPALYVASAPVLALYASGRTTGMVVESGYSTSHTVPIFEGFALYHAILETDIGGSHLTKYVSKVLGERGVVFQRAFEREVCEFVKERLGCVAPDYKAALANPKPASITLPDGTEITLGPERYTCCEALFHPAVIGLPEGPVGKTGLPATALASARKCDADIVPHLYGHVVLSGGSTMFPGFQERLLADLSGLAPSEKIKIFAATERKHAAWIGGSILASLPTFQDFWVTVEEFNEQGDISRHSAIHRNCL
eukprot:TRINITY_DN6269_c0_g1_i1.p1 TRINITY_DN6269_c0_g1~~TRINITY_DN6269_c0_g1_i1.p1  ORF type:complete len:396 (-),score=74.84 TRINITY_DN6269_c0_g1_i1:6-1193(-)